MDQEFSVEKVNFTIAKEKIIKTNELLLLYNEKNETLNKAKHAFKQLKIKYEATVHEVDRLKIDNERLNFNLQALKSKSEQTENDLHELRADYKRVDERYQQTMIDSQQTISDFEEKIRHCTCKNEVPLSPSKGRAVNEKVKELKQKCRELMKLESNLKNDCDNFQLKNNELKEENMKNLKVIADFIVKNAQLECKVQEMEKASKASHLQHTIKSLKQSHEKEIHSLKKEITKLSLDKERIRHLELECQNLKQQINRKNDVKVQKSHFGVQTEVQYFQSHPISKQDMAIQTSLIEPMQTTKVWEEDSSDFDYNVNDILSEMVLPIALSPMSFSSRLAESPTPPILNMFEPLPPMEEESFVQKSIPNIVITPPTPGTEIGNHSKVLFQLAMENTGKEQMGATTFAVVDPVLALENTEEVKHCASSNTQLTNIKLPLNDNNTAVAKNTNTTTTTTNSLSTCENSVSAQAGLLPLKTQGSVSDIDNLKTHNIHLQDDTLNMQERVRRHRRKFWVPRDMNPFVKLRKKRDQMLKTKVTRKYREISNEPNQGDTILHALKTLQLNNINFTISNDSIPLVQPYNCYSLLTPPKCEPVTLARRFTDTFSDSLCCWNKRCTVKNTQMLLKKVPNEEEPELLGFFSIKSEVITPATSRMAVMEKSKPFDAREFASQVLSGIKELVEMKRKESLGNRKKKRTKSKNRRSDFYSETETELEKLFRTSADVLGRNRRFLAAAKQQNFESNYESMFENESDAMIDSGLVTGTPKIDSDSMSLCSQYELGDEVVNNVFAPIIRKGENIVQNNVSQSDVLSPLENNECFAAVSVPSSIKTSATFKNQAAHFVNDCITPKFPTCPVMLSPIASSKGTPETLQDSSAPFKTPEFSGNLHTSPYCFKQPFCPDLISPMESSKGSPVCQTSTVIKNIDEDSLDSFRTSLCSTMVSPLTLFSGTNLENCSNKSEIIGCIKLSDHRLLRTGEDTLPALVQTKISNVDVLKRSNIDLQRLHDPLLPEILADEVRVPTKDVDDGKPSCSEFKSSVCQKITFDSVADNELLDQSIPLLSSDVENLPELISKNSVTSVNVTENPKEVTISSNLEENKLIQTKEDKAGPIEKVAKTTLDVDLNCTIGDISVDSVTSDTFTEPNNLSVDHSYSKTKPIKKQSAKKSACESIVERRYSLRRTSQSKVKNYYLESNESSEAEDGEELTSPRTRAAKRKFQEDLDNKEIKNGRVTRSHKSVEPIETKMPMKRKRERPTLVDKKTILSAKENLNYSKSVDRMSDSEINSPGKCTKIGNLGNTAPKKIFSSDSEDVDDISSKACYNPKQDTDNISESSDGTMKRRKKLLRKRSSRSINEDITQDLFDWALKGRGTKNRKESSEHGEREKKNINLANAVSSKDMEETCSEECQSIRHIKKGISKEFISESESECDASTEIITEPVKAEECFQNKVWGIEVNHSRNSANPGVLAQKENVSSTLDKSPFPQTEHMIEKEEKTMSDSKNSIQCSNSSNQAVTLEIQNILRNISEEAGQNTYLSGKNNVARRKSRPSTKSLFGDVTSSEDDSVEDLRVTENAKIARRGNLKNRMLNQVKGLVYASTKNKGCDNLKKSCVEVVRKGTVSAEEPRLEAVPDTEKEDKRINIVQNILISKGQAFNLLSDNGKGELPESSKSLSEEELTKPGSSKRIKLNQSILKPSTPVDILSQVMQGMIKTGPKMSRKNTSNKAKLTSSRQSRPNFNNVGVSLKRIEGGNMKVNVSKPWKVEEVIDNMDGPKSPDVVEVPDCLPMWIPLEKPERLQGSKVIALIDKLMIFSNEEKMLDDVIKEFAFQDTTFMVEIIVDKLANDYRDKADCLVPHSPPMTSTQRILLGFLLKLDKSTHPGIIEKFLSFAEMRLFNRFTCTLEIVQPITRMYTTLCKLRFDLNRIRRFMCEGFYFMGDLALSMFFTVLTMWPDVLPFESESTGRPLAKVLVQISYLKDCNEPGYNLIPLRDILKKYYGYPTERWDCEDVFKEIMVEYIRNPSIRLSDFTLLLFLRNKPTKWVYQKVKEIIIPLYSQTSDSNPNLKATLVILLANICGSFRPYEEYDWSVILEMDTWFINLDRDDLDPIIKRAIHLARGRLPRRLRKRKKGANKKTQQQPGGNFGSLESGREIAQDCTEKLSLEETREGRIEGNCSIVNNITDATERSMEISTNNIVNIDDKCSDGTSDICSGKNVNNSLSYDEEGDSASSSSDIEF